MQDAAEIQEEDANYLNRRSTPPDHPPIRPLYTRSDISAVMRLVKRIRYGQKTDLGRGVSFTLLDAGHILGSAYVILEWQEPVERAAPGREPVERAAPGREPVERAAPGREPVERAAPGREPVERAAPGREPVERAAPGREPVERAALGREPVERAAPGREPVERAALGREPGSQTRRLLFTADVGRYNTPIIRNPQTIPEPVDYLITESTYGGKTHGDIADVGPQLLQAARDCIQRRSRLLIPAFAVGRTQTILWYFQRFIQSGQIPQIPIYVDSPMAIEVTRIHSEFRDYYDDETRAAIGQKDLFGGSRVTYAVSPRDSQKINGDSGPCVIIASSPTCEFGRILHHLKLSVERPNDIVIFVGFTPADTLGRRLQNGQKRVRIYDRWYDLKCETRTIHGLSAHADGDELLRFLTPTIRPATNFYVVHGEDEQAEAFAARLVAGGAGRAVVPAMQTAILA